MYRAFPPFPQRLENGSRCSLVSHSYTPLLLLDTQTDSIRPASQGPESTEIGHPTPSSRAYSTTASARGRTASSRRASRGIEMDTQLKVRFFLRQNSNTG